MADDSDLDALGEVTEIETIDAIAIAIRKISREGPDRIVYNEQGDTATVDQMVQRGDTRFVTSFFIRRDGWALGAPDELRGVARDIVGRHLVFEFQVSVEVLDYEHVDDDDVDYDDDPTRKYDA